MKNSKVDLIADQTGIKNNFTCCNECGSRYCTTKPELGVLVTRCHACQVRLKSVIKKA